MGLLLLYDTGNERQAARGVRPDVLQDAVARTARFSRHSCAVHDIGESMSTYATAIRICFNTAYALRCCLPARSAGVLRTVVEAADGNRLRKHIIMREKSMRLLGTNAGALRRNAVPF